MYYLGFLKSILYGVISTFYLLGFAIFIPWLCNFLKFKRLAPGIVNPPITKMMMFINYVIIFLTTFFGFYMTTWIETSFNLINIVNDVIVAFLMLNLFDLMNFITHYASHKIKVLYRHSHYLHHVAQNPNSFSDSTNATALDWIIATVSGVVSIILFNQNIPRMLLYGLVTAGQPALNHCGCDLPKIPGFINSAEHWGHHLFQDVNYCENFIFVDKLMGTYMSKEDVIKRKNAIRERR